MNRFSPEGNPLPTFENYRDDFSFPRWPVAAGAVAAVATSALGFAFLAGRLLRASRAANPLR